MMKLSSTTFKSWHATMERIIVYSVTIDKLLMDVLCAKHCFAGIVEEVAQKRRAASKFGTAPLT